MSIQSRTSPSAFKIVTTGDMHSNGPFIFSIISFCSSSSILVLILQRTAAKVEAEIYASLLGKKLRKYPDRMRNSIMYKIESLLLDNPYSEERPSSASTIYSVPYQYTPTTSPQYVPNQNSTVTYKPPIYIRIPEENKRVQENLGNQIQIAVQI